jgi:hypothetical protein
MADAYRSAYKYLKKTLADVSYKQSLKKRFI